MTLDPSVSLKTQIWDKPTLELSIPVHSLEVVSHVGPTTKGYITVGDIVDHACAFLQSQDNRNAQFVFESLEMAMWMDRYQLVYKQKKAEQFSPCIFL